MSEDKDHGYGWDDLRKCPASELAVGDTFVSPGLGAAYFEGRDGRVRGAGWLPLDGTAWTVTARNGDAVTACRRDGRVETQDIPPGARVLKVVGPEPVGTVLAVNSHRAAGRKTPEAAS